PADAVTGTGLGHLVAVVELAATHRVPGADLDLGLDGHAPAEAAGDRASLLRRGGHAAVQHRQPVPGEQLAPLVLVQVHPEDPFPLAMRIPLAQPNRRLRRCFRTGTRCALNNSRNRRGKGSLSSMSADGNDPLAAKTAD